VGEEKAEWPPGLCNMVWNKHYRHNRSEQVSDLFSKKQDGILSHLSPLQTWKAAYSTVHFTEEHLILQITVM